MNNKWFQIQGQEASTLSISWGSVTGTPTTLAGYGVTDAYTKAETDTLLAAKADSATTLAGYGITDAYTKAEADALLATKADSATTLAGYGITDAYTKSAVDALLAALTTGDLTDWPADAAGVLTNDGAGNLSWGAGGGGAVSSVFGRTGAVVAAAGDYDAFYYTESEVDALISALDTRVDSLETNPLRVYANRAASAQSLTAGTTNTLIFNNEVTDSDAAYNPTTGIYTVPTTTQYIITVSAGVAVSSSGANMFLSIEVNGAIRAITGMALYSTTSVYGSVVLMAFLSAGDTVRARVSVPTGVVSPALAIGAYSQLSVWRKAN